MKKLTIIAFIALLCLLVMIPHSLAADNETIGNATDNVNPTDYYFDGNADSDGNGSADSPFKNFTDERIKENTNIHLASGEYVFEKYRTFSNISFYGESAQSTILNGNGVTLTVNGIVNFKNITLTNFRIVNSGTMNASNTIFRDLIPSSNDGHSYGGAIYAKSNKNIYLDNCILFSNRADYGGAIYVNGGSLTILNSLFYNNIAYSYGGAIAGESKVKIIINNTRFMNVSSTTDAGGAIYLISSTLKASNLNISNASATFGSAITSLKSDLNLTNLILRDNIAKYEGGAIYQIYGSIILNSSKFINNSARNGGGLFIDDVSVYNITFNDFIENTASNLAGAIYSLLSESNLTTNNFTDNHAGLFNDIYNTSMINLTIGNGNYTMYVVNQTSNSTLPSAYDLRQYGYVTPVRDQKDGGNCWAFAALASLESCILKASGEVLDLSEQNMKNILAYYSDYGFTNRMPNEGGDNDMPVGYLVSWLGPVNEADDAYNDHNHMSPVLNSLMHVQNVLYLKRDSATDNDAIKQAILNYGAVTTSMYYGAARIYNGKVYHYYTGDADCNHAVAIVGWDDLLDVPGAPGSGAWIAKNSWGDNWANGGYFYVSYYDVAFARPGTYASYTFILNDTQHFDKNYQYDFSGTTDYFWYPINIVAYENVFNATDDEFLAAVSTYFIKNTEWQIKVYVNSKLQIVQNGYSSPGYYTINLDYPIPLMKGDYFEVMFTIKVDGDVGFPISEYISLTKLTYSPRMSFVSFDGRTWLDLYDLEWNGYPGHLYSTQVACIKGFTQLITLNATIKDLNITYDSLDLFNITAKLIDENNNSVRNGNVTFNLNGVNHTVSVYNGIAFIQLPFVLGINNISAVFNSPNYYSASGNTTFEVMPIPLNMNITVLQDFYNAYINFTFSQPVNETLLIRVNDQNFTVNLTDGTYQLNLTVLDYGNYIIEAVLDSELYNSTNSTSFFVNVKKTHVLVDNLTAIYNSGEVLTVKLVDEFGESLSNYTVEFILNNVTYCDVTDGEGKITIPVNLTVGSYDLTVSFNGDSLHVNSTNSSKIIVNPSNTTITISDVSYDSFDLFDITVYVSDQFNQEICNGTVTITVNDVDYEFNVSGFGVGVQAHLVVGRNNISAVLTGDNYVSSNNSIQFDVLPVNLDLGIDVVQDFNNAYITFTSSQAVNETLLISVNDKNSSAKLINGVYQLNLTALDYGDYLIEANLDSDFYSSSNSTSFFVNVKKTYFQIDNFTVIYNSGEVLAVKLVDEFGESLSNSTVEFILNDETYCDVTDGEGKITIPVNLTVGSYDLTVSFNGDSLHVNSTNSSKIIVIPSNTTVTISDVSYDSFDLFDIAVYVSDQFNQEICNGTVIITVNDVDYEFNVSGFGVGVQAHLVVGRNNISAVLTGDNFVSSNNGIQFDVLPVNLDLGIDVVQDFNNAYITFTSSQAVNETLLVSVNDKNSSAKLVNGAYQLNLTALDYGNYLIEAKLDSDFYTSVNSTSFFVNVKRTYLQVNNLTTTYNSGVLLEIRLLDQFNQPVIGREVKFSIDNDVYRSDENGTVLVPISLIDSIYQATVTFDGDDLYIKSQNSLTITVKSTIKMPETKDYALNSNYEVYLLNKDGNALNNTAITFTFNNVEYTIVSDENGKATFVIPVNYGECEIAVLNPVSGEKLSQKINVLKRITENKDIAAYYGYNPTYKIRVCNDDGKFAANLEVKITVNKKVYNLRSDKNGYVSLKVNLNVGNYVITSEYKGFKVSNKIAIKQILITKNIHVKKGKTVKFNAKLLDKYGKVSKNKRITFKVKGKVYKAKTNKKGIATIKIKNLKVGSYIITSSYGKIKVSNKITIKK